jgi:hypothetical protein
MTIEDLAGDFNIEGTNQDATGSKYTGKLHMRLDTNHRIIAHWNISGNQIQHGSGFFKDNILVINFNYKNEDQLTFKGVVIFKCITKDVLDGFWSEKHGDPDYLGMEKAYRINVNSSLFH